MLLETLRLLFPFFVFFSVSILLCRSIMFVSWHPLYNTCPWKEDHFWTRKHGALSSRHLLNMTVLLLCPTCIHKKENRKKGWETEQPRQLYCQEKGRYQVIQICLHCSPWDLNRSCSCNIIQRFIKRRCREKGHKRMMQRMKERAERERLP